MILRLLCFTSFVAMAQTGISGSFKLPNGDGLNGYVTVRLEKATVTNGCATGIQVLTLAPVTAVITNGVLGSLSLWASPCLSVVPPTTTPKPVTAVGPAAGGNAPAAGDKATVTFTCTTAALCNVSGVVTLHTGSSPNPVAGSSKSFTTDSTQLAQNTLGLLILQTVNGNQPYCTLFPFSSNANLAPVVWRWAVGRKTTTLTLAAGDTALSPSTDYQWTYQCVQPYAIVVYQSDGTMIYRSLWAVPNNGGANVAELDAR